MVMAPASTGRDRSNKIAVIKIDHTNRGMQSDSIPRTRKFRIVEMKFTAPSREEIPAKCREKIAKSTDTPSWLKSLLSGGYTVHPVPAPCSTILLKSSKNMAGIKNQNLMLFNRGKAISALPSIKGTSQFPNPPIITGMTMKKIIIKA